VHLSLKSSLIMSDSEHENATCTTNTSTQPVAKRSYKYKCREAGCRDIVDDKKWRRHCDTKHKFKSTRHEPIKREIVHSRIGDGPWMPYVPSARSSTAHVPVASPSPSAHVQLVSPSSTLLEESAAEYQQREQTAAEDEAINTVRPSTSRDQHQTHEIEVKPNDQCPLSVDNDQYEMKCRRLIT
jgi:hypothetical protein